MESERVQQAKDRLRAALSGVELDPQETADDRALRAAIAQERESADDQLLADVPPHHVPKN